MKLDLTGAAIKDRIRAASDLTDLRPRLRLHAKIPMSGSEIARRIKAASEMLTLCRQLAAGAGDRRGRK